MSVDYRYKNVDTKQAEKEFLLNNQDKRGHIFDHVLDAMYVHGDLELLADQLIEHLPDDCPDDVVAIAALIKKHTVSLSEEFATIATHVNAIKWG